MNEDFEMAEAKTKSWIYVLIIFISVGGIAWFIYSIYLSFKAFGEDLSKNTYHVLELTDDNREKVISILNKEDRDYCESIYKIEIQSLFPNDYYATVYCNNQSDIKYSIASHDNSELIKYIDENGTTERR